MKHTIHKALVFGVTFGGVLAFQNCGYVDKPMDPLLSAGSASLLSTGTIIPFSAVQSQVLNPQCLGCHSASNASGGVDLSSYAKVVTLVKAGNPSSSLLYTEIASGSMPMGGTLAPELKTLVYNWIATGANNTVATPTPNPGATATPVATATPTPTPSPTPPSTGTATASFTWLEANIFKPRCTSCHGEMLSYSGVTQYVSPGSSSLSPLYLRTASTNSADRMPQGGAALSTSEEAALKSWIDLGAMNN